MDYHDSYYYPRDSISTFDSEHSTHTAPSIFSVARSNSRASDITTYSDHSLHSARSCSSSDLLQRSTPISSTTRDRFAASVQQLCTQLNNDPRRTAAIRAATQRAAFLSDNSPTPAASVGTASHQATPLAEKQATNKFACSHCSEVFTKKSDRKKHWLNVCQFLGDTSAIVGDGFVCPGCDHVARNVPQQNKHGKISGHEGEWEAIRLCKKERYTCSTHQTIYRSAAEFYAHFDSRDCPLNNHSGGKEGYRHHQARIVVLLQEGKFDNTYLYAALMVYCNLHELCEQDWKAVVERHPASEALALANRLEWGLRRADGSAISRLGFTDLMEMVAAAVPLAGISARTQTSESNRAQSRKLSLPPSEQQAIACSSISCSDDERRDLPTIDYITATSTSRANSERLFKDSFASLPTETTLPRHVQPARTYRKCQTAPPKARFVERIEENVAHSATLREYGATTWEPHQDRQQHQGGFAVHTTQPLPYGSHSSPAIDWQCLLTIPHPDPDGLQQHNDIKAVWDQGMGRTISNDAWMHEMEVLEHAPPIYLPRSSKHSSFAISVPDEVRTQAATGLDPWTLPAPLVLQHDDDYPDRQALTPSPPGLALSTKKAKRPISNSSAVLPDSTTRAKVGPRQTLALRPNSKDSSTFTQSAHCHGAPIRWSGESVVGTFFKYDEYYSQDPVPTLQLPGTKSRCDDAPDIPRPSSPERSKDPAQAVKAVFRKMRTPSIREIGDDLPSSQLPVPRSSTRVRSNSSQCIHCGKVDNISCFTDHISNDYNSRTNHRRRNASIYNPEDVAQAFQDFQDQSHTYRAQ